MRVVSRWGNNWRPPGAGPLRGESVRQREGICANAKKHPTQAPKNLGPRALRRERYLDVVTTCTNAGNYPEPFRFIYPAAGDRTNKEHLPPSQGSFQNGKGGKGKGVHAMVFLYCLVAGSKGTDGRARKPREKHEESMT